VIFKHRQPGVRKAQNAASTLAALCLFAGLSIQSAHAQAAAHPKARPATTAAPASAGPNNTAIAPATLVAITGGKLLTITHGTIENGVIVLENGKIAAVGPAASTKVPKDAQVFDAKGMTVYPGLFDAETNLGLTEVESDENSNDLVEKSDEISPQMRVVDAFHAETARIPVQRINGVTNAIVAPAAEDSVAGQDALIQLYGKDRNAMILTPDIALAMNFEGDSAAEGVLPEAPNFPPPGWAWRRNFARHFSIPRTTWPRRRQRPSPTSKVQTQEGPQVRSPHPLFERGKTGGVRGV
jgi:hypothetical protein